MPVCFPGIDLGTSGTKALVLRADGTIVAHSTRKYETKIPRPSWTEQNPSDWWNATRGAVSEVLQADGVHASQIEGIGLTGQMHGLVPLDSQGAVLRPVILWNDQRTRAACDRIHERVGRERVVGLTGNPVLPGFTAPKILWMREHEPHLHDRIATILLPKDYLRYKLTGTYATDVSDASGTALFDVEHRRWSDEMIKAIDLPSSWLPPVIESSTVSAHLSEEVASEMGLPSGIPVVGGAGDQAASAVGTAAVQEGTVSITMGTSGVVFATSNEYRADPAGRLHAFCHAVPDTWHLMGVMLSAAGSLRWFRNNFLLENLGEGKEDTLSYDELISETQTVLTGADGLLFLPYLSGERTPHADPNARGVFFGLHLGHEREHLTRSILEGVAFGLRDSMELMTELGLSAEEIRVSGGGAQSAHWRQILSDVLDADLVHTTVPHGAAVGAALLAGVGAGVYDSVREAARIVYDEAGVTAPAQDRRHYDALYERFKALYPALDDHFDSLVDVAEQLKEKRETS